jgi:hypothetical protein
MPNRRSLDSPLHLIRMNYERELPAADNRRPSSLVRNSAEVQLHAQGALRLPGVEAHLHAPACGAGLADQPM